MVPLSPQQVRKLSELMKSGFEEYAATHGARMRIGSVTDGPEKNTTLIRSYGTEFVRILKQTEWTELREDLFVLTEEGCPKLDIIQLAFACTRGRSLAMSDTLASIGLAGPSFHILARLCEMVSEKIAALDIAGGPVDSLSELLPELPDNEDRARFVEQLRLLPQTLSFYGNYLGLYAEKKEPHKKIEPILKDHELVLLYNLLAHYGLGFPTLSRILMAMREARFKISPKTRYVDTFSDAALQRRLHRFSKEYKDWQLLISWSVLQYLSGEWSAQRASGETLYDLVFKILKKPMNVAIPVVVSPTPRPDKPVGDSDKSNQDSGLLVLRIPFPR
jgi:hypothetical protein